MEPSPKTTCTRCGAGILQVTADLNDGHCMPCVRALAREKEPRMEFDSRRYPKPLLDHVKPEDGVILSVSYDPGWSPDHTSWVIQVSDDGQLRQAMEWDRDGKGEVELFAPVSLGASELGEIQQLIASWSHKAFHALEMAACVDDAATVSLVMPAQGVKASFPYFLYKEGLKSGWLKFDEVQRAAFELFGKLWRFADRHAPYRLRDHEKKRR